MQDEWAVQLWRNLRNLRIVPQTPQLGKRKRYGYGMLPI